MRIRWTTTALVQINAICDFWTAHNQSTGYAFKIIKQSDKALTSVKKNPKAFPFFPNTEYRKIAMEDFSIIYSIRNEEILVLAFWDNRQSPKRLRKILEVHRDNK